MPYIQNKSQNHKQPVNTDLFFTLADHQNHIPGRKKYDNSNA